MLFYSDYSYDASWSVRCALAEHHDDCVENNPNWQEYILSYSGCYDVPITQFTPNTYNYISMLSGMDERFVTSVRLSFQNNQPNNDRHIAIAQEATHNSAKWEIVLGGWGGSQSVIRPGNQGTNLVAVQHSVNDFHNWASEIDVRFGDGYVQVWSLSNDLEIIAYNSNEIQQSEMREFMVSSGWGASGDWTITGVSCGNGCYDVPITQFTPNTYNYISMLSGMDERFVTSVRLSFQNNQPNNDRHIAIAQEATHNSAKWEIVLGGWRGRQSVIRSGNQ